MVYRAVQTSTGRDVAIKVMHEGPFLGGHSKARFDREVRILATLQHPNIVTIHDSGTAAGSHYFVMDYIPGQPLDSFMASRKCSVDETLTLFAKICEAVNAAHLRGIIHRDLKPTNIQIDESGEPQILDFGLAKTETEEIGDATHWRTMTVTGQFVGSLPWASPEQADGTPEQIDLRTDVYSLGVILYHMLTGTFPYSVTGKMREALSNILEAEPARPGSIRKDINDEVETIVLKCLAKDPDRRYQSAGELAKDIHRYLSGDVIEAKRESTLYVLRKQMRRHRVPLAVGLTFVLLLIVSSVVAWTLYVRSQNSLWQSHLSSARAHRKGGQPGRRFETLEALAKAAAIRPSVELRTEAIAAMTLFDIRPIQQREIEPGWSDVNFGARLEQYVLGHASGQVSVRRVEDGQETFGLSGYPGPRQKRWYPNPMLSPDGRYIVRGTDAGCEVWDIQRDLLVAEVPAEWVGRRPFDFSSDSELLAVGTGDGSVVIHDLASGERHVLRPMHAPVYNVRFHPERTVLGTVSLRDTDVLVRDVYTGELIRRYTCPKAPHSVLVWSPDSRLLAVGCEDLRVYVWDTESGQARFALTGHRGFPVNVDFDHSGRLLLSYSWDSTTRFWDVRTGRELLSTEQTGLRFAANGPRVAMKVGDPTRMPGIAEVAHEREYRSIVSRTADESSRNTAYITISKDGRLAATGGMDGVRLWDLDAGSEIALLPLGPTQSVIFHPEKLLLFTVGEAGVLRWSVHTVGQVLEVGPPEVLVPRSRGRPEVACLSPDSRTLVVTVDFEYALVLDLEQQSDPRVFSPQREMKFVTMSADRQWIATGTYSQDSEGVKLWNMEGDTEPQTLPVSGPVRVAFSPDGRWLVTSHAGHTVWEVGTWQPRWHLPGAASRGYVHGAITFSPGGDLLAVMGDSDTIELVDFARREVIAHLECPGPIGMAACAFTPDGTRLVHPDTQARLLHIWDLRAIREQLAEIDLDWDLPPYPPAPSIDQPEPLRVEVDLGELARSSTG